MPALQVSPIVAALDQPEVSLDPRGGPERWRCPWWRRSARSPTRVKPAGSATGGGDHAARGVRGADRGAVVRRDRRVRPRHRPRILDLLGVGAVVPHASTIRRVL